MMASLQNNSGQFLPENQLRQTENASFQSNVVHQQKKNESGSQNSNPAVRPASMQIPQTQSPKVRPKVPPPVPPRNRPSSASASVPAASGTLQNTQQSFNVAQHKLRINQAQEHQVLPQQRTQSPQPTHSAGSSPRLPSSPRYRYEFVHYPQPPVSPRLLENSSGKLPSNNTPPAQSGTKQSSIHIKMSDYHAKQTSQDTPPPSPMYRSYAVPVQPSQSSSHFSQTPVNIVHSEPARNGLPHSSHYPQETTNIQQRLAQYPKTSAAHPSETPGGFAYHRSTTPHHVPNSDLSRYYGLPERRSHSRSMDHYSPVSSPQHYMRDPNRQASFSGSSNQPAIPPRSLSLERPSTLLSPVHQPRGTSNSMAQASPKSPRSRLQLSLHNTPSRASPGQTFSPGKSLYPNQMGPPQPHPMNVVNSISPPQALQNDSGRNTPTNFNIPLRNLSLLSNDTSSSPDSPGSFSLPGRNNFWGSPGSPAHQIRTNSPGPQAGNLNLNRPARKKMDMSLAMSPGQPKTPDASEIEMKYQEVMKRSGLLTLGGKQVPTEIEELESLGELGHGSCGHVMKMRHMKTGHIMAVKQMRRTGNRDENKRIIMDMDVVTKCHNCPFIVQCIGVFITKSDVWICMELMSTCLDKLLKKIKQPFPEKILGKVAVATVNALNFLKEEHGVIHRDVKPSNILLDESGSIKLCDFGISGRLVDSKAKTRTGCAAYMAPERIEPPDPTRPDYDIRADVWSFGISLVELATGAFPYPDCKNDFEVLTRVLQEQPPCLPADGAFSPEFRDFVKSCLIKDFNKRPKYRQLLRNVFIQNFTAINVDVAQWYQQLAQLGEGGQPGGHGLTTSSTSNSGVECSPAVTV